MRVRRAPNNIKAMARKHQARDAKLMASRNSISLFAKDIYSLTHRHAGDFWPHTAHSDPRPHKCARGFFKRNPKVSGRAQSPEDKIIRRRVQRLQWQPHHDFALFCGRRLKRNGVGGTRRAFNFSNLAIRQIAGNHNREARPAMLAAVYGAYFYSIVRITFLT
jgi:hypothetical protein